MKFYSSGCSCGIKVVLSVSLSSGFSLGQRLGTSKEGCLSAPWAECSVSGLGHAGGRGNHRILLDPGQGPRRPQIWVPAQSLCPVSHIHESSVNTKGSLNTVSTATLSLQQAFHNDGHYGTVYCRSGVTPGSRDQTGAWVPHVALIVWLVINMSLNLSHLNILNWKIWEYVMCWPGFRKNWIGTQVESVIPGKD